jgi:membrane protein HdeD
MISKIPNVFSPVIWGVASVLTGVMFIWLNIQIVNWILILLGCLLLLAGIIPIISSIIRKKSLPLVSSFEAIIGLIVLVFNTKLIALLFILLGALLILAGIQQINTLINIKRINGINVPFYHYLIPILCIIGGVIAIWNPFAVQATLLIFIGWCILLHGLWTLISLLLLRFRN